MALASPAFAQDDAEIIITAQKLNRTEVTRAGQLGALGDKLAEDVPFSIKSYNEALILNQQPQTLGQLLENDPSVRTTYGFGNAAEQFVIRGFTLNGDDVAIDGLYGIAPRQLVAPELYDSVQVLNGASAFLFGAAPGGSGIGGTVNLIPKRAGGSDLARVTASYTSDAHLGGSFDVARRLGPDGALGVRLNGAVRRGDVSVDDEFRSTYVAGGAVDWRGEAVRLSLDLAYQRIRVSRLRPKVALGAGVTAVPRVPRAKANFAQAWGYSNLRDLFGVAHAEWDIADNAMLYASFGARDGSETGIYDGLTVNDAATGDGTGSALFVPRTDNNEAGEAGIRVKLAAGGVSHEFNLGGSASWQVNRNAYDFLGGSGGFATNLYSPPVVPLPGSGFVGGDLDHPFPISRSRLTSAFASDAIGIWDDRILLTAGLRLQTIRTIGYDAATSLRSGGYDKDAVTPVIGLVVKPVAGVSLFANRIQALVAGDTAPNTASDANGNSIPVINAGEALPPYKSTQYEIGGKVRVGAINASVALFQTRRLRTYAAPDPAAPGFFRFAAFGEQRNRGVEFSLDGEVTEGLRLIGGLSVIDARLRDTGNAAEQGKKAPGVPDYLANANVEWDVPFMPALTLTGRVVRTGEQQVNALNTLEIPGWTRFDLGARYVVVVGGKPLTLRANVDNVANKRYWSSAFDTFSPQLLQGNPRTFKLSASIDL
nr:TonB-dependent receptor [Sphingomonas quercus]